MGSPIRKSSDQSPVGGSPRLIAASNVLHRSCLPRHPPYALASNTHHESAWPQDSPANSQTTNHHTKNDHKTIETNNRVRFEINSKTKKQKTLFCSRPLSSSQATTHRHAIAPAHGRPPGTTGIESRQAKAWGGDPGAQKRIHTTPAPTARPAGQSQRHLPHQQPRRHRTMRRAGRTPSDEHPTEFSVERR